MASSQTYLGNVAVLGLGVSGEALLHDLLLAKEAGRVNKVVAYGAASPERRAQLKKRFSEGVTFKETQSVDEPFDLCVVSPGISVFSPFFASAEAHGREVIGEPEFVWRESPERWIAITGTNGKTTTTALTAALLNESGLPAMAVGNIGGALASALPKRTQEWFVAELSSYQLATTRFLHPRVAILLNVTPDHLLWHRSFEHYAASKEKIFANLAPQDLAILGVDDPFCAHLATELTQQGLSVLGVSWQKRPATERAAWMEGEELWVCLGGDPVRVATKDILKLKGAHNYCNVLAAASAALFVGAVPKAVTRGLSTFLPLEHRIEEVGSVAGVTYINDSKATNTDATEKALGAMKPGHYVVLLGGSDKGTDLSHLAHQVAESAKAAVCFGDAGARFARALTQTPLKRLETADHLADAFAAAVAIAEPGDSVLLSPACASFDEFHGFEERGRAFKDLVATLQAAS